MGVLDDILEPPPRDMTSREMAFAIIWSGLKWFCGAAAVIFGVPILFLILITLIY